MRRAMVTPWATRTVRRQTRQRFTLRSRAARPGERVPSERHRARRPFGLSLTSGQRFLRRTMRTATSPAAVTTGTHARGSTRQCAPVRSGATGTGEVLPIQGEAARRAARQSLAGREGFLGRTSSGTFLSGRASRSQQHHAVQPGLGSNLGHGFFLVRASPLAARSEKRTGQPLKV